MERSVQVATGESVAFSYELAGLGSRFLAVFIDTVLQLCVLLFLTFAFLLVASYVAPGVSGSPTAGSAKLARSILMAAAILGGFVLFFGYFIVFETLWNGRTPGKRMLGIRVVRDGGFPVDFTSALIRNVVRVVEVALGAYAISAISALLSPLNRRLGDFAAGTLVVRDSAMGSVPVPPSGDERMDDPLVRDLGSHERDLVRRYVARRVSLGSAARASLAPQIAAVVRPHLAARFEHLDDDALLVHVERALR
jgi:uncharacterized RDD family membrane protein YckC